MFIFTKKDRKIANLETKVKNRDNLIENQQRIISNLLTIINSLEDDLKSTRETAYELQNKQTRRKRTKKEAN